jgi:starch synthase (maltosyl-transferring)
MPVPPATVSPYMKQLHDERIIIADVTPQIDQGRYPVKRIVGDTVEVQATIFRDGHDQLAATLQYGPEDTGDWHELPMKLLGNDRWSASFLVDHLTNYKFTIEAWTDVFGTWQAELRKKFDAKQEVTSELLEGVEQVLHAAKRATESDHQFLLDAAQAMRTASLQDEAVAVALDDALKECMARNAEHAHSITFDRLLTVVVDRPQARFATWYELFPRSQGKVPGKSGTFADCINRLPDIAHMGFDVLYLPPIHPIGRTHRKGKNNSLLCTPSDPGCPWAIGNEQGGHYAIEPSLGTLQDFKNLIAAARDLGMEIALDFAIQCSPDHPYVKDHPEWFSHRPDGTIKYAENPPKKYQDIYPVNFDSQDWQSLWPEWRRVLLYWVAQGVKTFRVDNPHTKPVGFWDWLLAEIKQEHPDVIFLAEAFTRPAMMKTLAKAGFTQSYTYFTWRNTKAELTEYATELTQTDMKEYYRGHFFANTPDILHEYLQKGGRSAFKIRYILAATLSTLCGIYSGYELSENVPLKQGSEEYLDSDKYEIKVRDWNAPGNIKEFIHKVNKARRENPALQINDNIAFHEANDPQILCYSKATPDGSNAVIVAVNLDPFRPHEDLIVLDLDALGLEANEEFQVQDVMTGSVWTWKGSRNYVRLDPRDEPAHLLVVKRAEKAVVETKEAA